MEVKKIILLFFSIAYLFSQTIDKGFSRFTSTLSVAAGNKENSFFLYAGSEIYISPSFSFRGETFYYLGNFANSVKYFNENHFILAGGNLHLIKNKNDFSFSLSPGIALVKPTFSDHVQIEPVACFNLSYYCYFHRFFHFFVDNKFLLYNNNYTDFTNYYILSVGLGFNF